MFCAFENLEINKKEIILKKINFKKSVIYFILSADIFVTTIFISSCNTPDKNDIASTIKLLSSTQYEGRLYGTEGNEKTADCIAKELKTNGLVPYSEDDYLASFKASLPTIENTELIIFGDQDIILEQGKDYIYSPMLPVSLKGTIPVSFDNALEQVTIKTAQDIDIILNNSDIRVGNGTKLSKYEETKTIELGLTKDALEKVMQNAGAYISFKCTGTTTPVELNNVVGILPGKDNSKAVIIGAHFDHMGMVGDILYGGAVDNASGVATVLDITKKLSGVTPEVDIVFAFWNAEEVGMLGSSVMVKEFSKKYDKYCYINIDCIGLKNAGKTLITTANSSVSLCEEFEKQLKDIGYENAVYSDEYMPSDHNNFSSVSSINFGQSMEALNDVIHRPSDTFEQINVTELEEFSDALSKVILKNAISLPDIKMYTETFSQDNCSIVLPEGDYLSMSYAEQMQYVYEIEKQLAYDEVFLLPDALLITSSKGRYFSSIEDVQELYPEVNIKESVGDYELKQIIVNALFEPLNELEDKNEEIIGKVTKRKVSSEYITGIELYYEYNGRMLIFTEILDTDISEASPYELHELSGFESTWITYDDETGDPAEILKQVGSNCYTVSQSPTYVDQDGLYSRFLDDDPSYDEEHLTELFIKTESAYPLVTIN